MSSKNIKSLKEVLKKEGLRFTQQRLHIWEEIENSQKHRDADEIYMSICNKGKKVSRY